MKTKDELEIEKLQAEISHLHESIKDLQKPAFYRPAFFISFTTALVAIAGVFLQYQFSEVQFKVSELNDLKLQQQIEEKEVELQQVSSEIGAFGSLVDAIRGGEIDPENVVTELEQYRQGVNVALSQAYPSDRFARIPPGSDPIEFLTTLLLTGYWSQADVLAIRRINTPDRNGWSLSEQPREEDG